MTIENEILARIQSKTPFAVLYLDLNSFKAYNDIYGFVKGDDVIRELEVSGDRSNPSTIEAKVRLKTGTTRVAVSFLNQL